jgi:hypothetical protein
MEKLKTFPMIWKIKFAQEFTSHKEHKEVLGDTKMIESFFSRFKDHAIEEGESTFDFYKRSIYKQMEIRQIVEGVVC